MLLLIIYNIIYIINSFCFFSFFLLASGIGKTSLLCKILEDNKRVFKVPPKNIHIFFSEEQPAYTYIQEKSDVPVYLHTEQPSPHSTFERGSLIIFDDYQQDQSALKVINTYFTKKAHHHNLSVVFICQNLYDPQNKIIRSINLNSTALILFNNIRDRGVINTLNTQLGYRAGYLKDVISDLMQKSSRNYLFIDLHPDTQDKFRLRSSVFVDFPDCVIYIPVK